MGQGYSLRPGWDDEMGQLKMETKAFLAGILCLCRLG